MTQFVVKVVREALGECQIFLFGSRAKGLARANSDYDFAVQAEREVPFSEWAQIVNRVDEEAPTLMAIDMVDLSSRSVHQELKDSIRREGVRVG